MNYKEILEIGSKNLKINKIKNSNLESELILSKVLDKTREQILVNFANFINKKQINKFKEYLYRRKKKRTNSIYFRAQTFLEI